MSSHQPRSPQDRGNLEYNQLVRPALGGQGGTRLRSSSRVVSRSSRASEQEGPQGHSPVGVGACAEERLNPASTSNPNCPATPRQRGFSRHAGTSSCGPGTTRTTGAISTQGNFPEGSSHPVQPPKGQEDPRAGSEPEGHHTGPMPRSP